MWTEPLTMEELRNTVTTLVRTRKAVLRNVMVWMDDQGRPYVRPRIWTTRQGTRVPSGAPIYGDGKGVITQLRSIRERLIMRSMEEGADRL